MMSDLMADEIMMADTLRYIARYRRDSLALGQHRTPRSSKDNVGCHDSHKANTYRRQPRTAYSNPSLGEGTSPGMKVTLADGSEHIVPATRNWRSHLKQAEVKDHRTQTERVGGSQADYD